MKSTTYSKAVLLIASMFILQRAAFATGSDEQYVIKQSVPSVGTTVSKVIVLAGAIPLDKRYGELTPEQVAKVKADYSDLKDGDEPPFPLQGLRGLYQVVANSHEKNDLQHLGKLSLFLTIDKDGNVQSIEVYASPDADITQEVTQKVARQKFKPALCSGQPCAMQFPLRAELVSPNDTHVIRGFAATEDVLITH
jgi:hypothetical protein